MAKSYGEVLDKLDRERYEGANVSHDVLSHESVEELRQKLLGKSVAENLRNGASVFLTGRTAENPLNIAPLLYFHRTFALQICVGCPQTWNTSILQPFLERGLVSVFLTGPFEKTPAKFQNLVSHYPELFVGPRSFYLYKHFTLHHGILPSGQHTDKVSKAWSSVYKKMRETVSKLSKFEGLIGVGLGSVYMVIEELPEPVAIRFGEQYLKTFEKPTKKSVKELWNSANAADSFVCTKVLGSASQLESHFLGASERFLDSLRIKVPAKIDLNQYLDFVNDYRGVIPPEAMPAREDEVIRRVIEINEEVSRIQSSYRLLLGSYAWKFVAASQGLFSRLIRVGRFGPEGAVQSPMASSKKSVVTEVCAGALAGFFGTSRTAVHVWQIRYGLEKLAKSPEGGRSSERHARGG